MSDISAPVAPSTPTPPTQTPQTSHNPSEVVINPNPPSSPNPVGSQAPQAPTSDRPPSRREAIQAAFDKATRQQDAKAGLRLEDKKDAPKPNPPAAEAKPGHNKPPEPTEGEQPKLNLKKRPEEQDPKAIHPDPQPRDRGKFAPRVKAEDGPVNAGISEPESAKPGTYRQLPENAPFREPPQRMAEHAKAEWHAAPESVRGEVHRMHDEFGKAYQAYRQTWDAFQPIMPYHQLAQQHGTTLEKALHNFTSIENKLRSDVVGGLDVIVNNLGIPGPNGQRITLRDIAYHVLQQSPEQLQQMQMGNAQTAASMQIGALHQEIAGLKDTLQQWQTAQQFTYTSSQVDQFAASHPRFDELGTLIEKEIQLGFDLETAYRRAELLQPATQAVQTRATPAPQTRAPADRSISGSPGMNGATPSHRRSEKPVGRREAIANAIKRVQGVA